MFSLVTGIALVLFYERIADVTGVDPSTLLAAVGLGLVTFAVFVWRTAAPENINRSLAWIIISLDLFWVAGTAGLILVDYFTGTGNWIVALLSVVVLLFAFAQYAGIRRADRVYPGRKENSE